MNTLSKLFIAIVAVGFITTSASAQFEGRVNMKMEATELPAEYEPMKSMFESTIVTYVKGKKSRTEMTAAMSGTTITLNDEEKGESITCIDMMGQKMATKVKHDDSKKADEELNARFKKEDGTKVIAGYTCKKGTYTTEASGEKQEVEVWYTEEISNTKADMREIPGMPLEMFISTQGVKLHFFVTEVIKEKVSNKMFEMPEGYRVVTSEEMAKKLSGQ